MIHFVMMIENSEGFRLCQKMTIISYHFQYTVPNVIQVICDVIAGAWGKKF